MNNELDKLKKIIINDFMKNLANYISLSRIVLSILLLFTKPLSFYLFLYV